MEVSLKHRLFQVVLEALFLFTINLKEDLKALSARHE